MQTNDVRVIDRVPVSASICLLTLLGVPYAESIRPGQFVMLRIPGRIDPLLARPYSVYDAEGTAIRILVKVVGKSSALFSSIELGSRMQCTGPLGNAFRVRRGEAVVMVAGGVGLAPMFLLAKRHPRNRRVLLYGSPNRDDCMALESFTRLGVEASCMTEDGSMGTRGLVTEPLAGLLAGLKGSAAVFACGPEPMLRAVARIAEKTGHSCQVSVEERMACGIGVCQGCAVRVKSKNKVGYRYKLSCHDGPIFDTRELWPEGAAQRAPVCKEG